MKKTFYLLLAVFFSLPIESQKLYRFSNDIEREIENDKNNDSSIKYQLGSMKYSISNYYYKALKTWDNLGALEKKMSKEDSLKFTKYLVNDAKDYILKKSKDKEIIILNEAHHNASHRTFATLLLRGLYENGYRYLGIETLADVSINDRKFPTINSGVYSSEPQFGNFIKTALDLGFILFYYDDDSGSNGKEREIIQAENIYNFMKKNKKGKYFIYCGYEHAYKGTHPNWEKTMTERLSDLTKLNPYTIDQTQFSEKSSPQFNEPLIKLLNIKNSSILIDVNKNVFNGNNKNMYTDITVINPITKYLKGRPNWMLIENRKFYEVPKTEFTNYPSLVFAYRKGEYEKKGIPADLIEIVHPKDFRFLILEKGNYEIIIKDKNYKIVNKFMKTIK